MKLASLKGGRDGRLVVVSDDLAWYADAGHIAPTLQAALDAWDRVGPDLANLATDLAHEAIPMMRFHERNAAAPLPRAYQRFQAGPAAGIDHGGAGTMLGARDPVPLVDADWGYDFAGEVAVVTDDVPRGATREQALDAIRLVLLANDIRLRSPGQSGNGGTGLWGTRPATALSPVAVTPDALGPAWADGRLHLPLLVALNDRPFARLDAGATMRADFASLIADAARTGGLGAGTIVGSGPLAMPAADDREPTQSLSVGDSIRIEMRDAGGHSLFGAIEQSVEAA